MNEQRRDQSLAKFLREAQGEAPTAPADLEDAIWLLAGANRNGPIRPTRKNRLASLAFGAALLAAAAAALTFWPGVDRAQEDAELTAFIEASWDSTFDETNEDYDLAQLSE